MFSYYYYIKRKLLEGAINSNENDQILLRWFYVKKYFWFLELVFISAILYWTWWISFISFGGYFSPNLWLIAYENVVSVFFWPIYFIFMGYLLVVFFLLYIFFDKLFFTDRWIYVFWKTFNSTHEIKNFWWIFRLVDRVLYWNNLPKYFDTKYWRMSGKSGRYITVGIFLIFLFVTFRTLPISIEFYLSSLLIVCILRQLVEHFHPLYAFGNLWEKIQKLTPIIEAKSKEIQKHFEQDMNFQVLSDGFDTLSTTFSEIIILVIKLEHVERKANKWKLFDSAKYINSLRSDIVEPLKQLKSFLEKQREALLHSQKELLRIKVQVGADPSFHSGWGEQAELSSKRSEPLLWELTENIEKLDAMIQKISK